MSPVIMPAGASALAEMWWQESEGWTLAECLNAIDDIVGLSDDFLQAAVCTHKGRAPECQVARWRADRDHADITRDDLHRMWMLLDLLRTLEAAPVNVREWLLETEVTGADPGQSPADMIRAGYMHDVTRMALQIPRRADQMDRYRGPHYTPLRDPSPRLEIDGDDDDD